MSSFVEEENDENKPRDSMYVPAIKMGWMTKQGRKGFVKSWKKRYFILNAGKISYYQDASPKPPYGEGLKGEMTLSNTEIITENKNYNDKQIMLVSYNGEYNMLMEADDADTADSWSQAIQDHIIYADRDNADAVNDPLKAESRRFKARSMMLEKKSEDDDDDDRKSSAMHRSSDMPTRMDPSKRVEVEEDMCELKPYISSLVQSITDNAADVIDADKRKEYFSFVQERTHQAWNSAVSSASQGELGRRGEEWIVALLVLFLPIAFSLHHTLVQFMNFFIQLSAVVYMFSGLLLIADAVIQLGSSFSLFPEPNESNMLCIKGSYRLVRHPMYGGVILLTVGLSITSCMLYKLVLALVFVLLLDRVAFYEESLLLQDYPLEYRKFIASRRKFVPFVF